MLIGSAPRGSTDMADDKGQSACPYLARGGYIEVTRGRIVLLKVLPARW